jgi:hypothetical protein
LEYKGYHTGRKAICVAAGLRLIQLAFKRRWLMTLGFPLALHKKDGKKPEKHYGH